jgi:hypothetical protein
MDEKDRFAVKDYFRTLTRLWFSPGRFFRELPESPRVSQPLSFLLLSSLIVTAGTLIYLPERTLLMAAVVFINAAAMPFVASAFGYLVVTMMMGKRVGYRLLLSVYAFSSGATLPLAWLPFSLWFTETWKWVLIGIGLVKGCGLRPLQSAAVIAFSVIILVLFFWSLGPAILWFKGAGG